MRFDSNDMRIKCWNERKNKKGDGVVEEQAKGWDKEQRGGREAKLKKGHSYMSMIRKWTK